MRVRLKVTVSAIHFPASGPAPSTDGFARVCRRVHVFFWGNGYACYTYLKNEGFLEKDFGWVLSTT